MEGPNKFPTADSCCTMAGVFLVTRSVLMDVSGVYNGERGASGILGIALECLIRGGAVLEGQCAPSHGAVIVWQAGGGVINTGSGVVAFGPSIMVSLTKTVEVTISYTTCAVLVTCPEQLVGYWAPGVAPR